MCAHFPPIHVRGARFESWKEAIHELLSVDAWDTEIGPGFLPSVKNCHELDEVPCSRYPHLVARLCAHGSVGGAVPTRCSFTSRGRFWVSAKFTHASYSVLEFVYSGLRDCANTNVLLACTFTQLEKPSHAGETSNTHMLRIVNRAMQAANTVLRN